MIALLLVAVALGLSNLAASVGIGISGTGARTRLRVGVIFGLFETGMPVIGLLLGRGLAAELGRATQWTGAALLIITGLYQTIQAARSHTGPADEGPASAALPGTGRLLLAGIALSVDNLAVGFALGAYHISLAVAVVVIGTVSVAMSLLGLELGDRLGARTGQRGEILGGIVLTGVGIALAAGVL
ncbi:MAG: manganese efflux pump MntP family protein [Streptosporangiaceae bacterium]